MSDFFRDVRVEPPNSILGVSKECGDDKYEHKINLTIGAYRTEDGKPCVLECVKEAEEVLFNQHLDHEYLGQDGLPEFVSAAQKLMFGTDSSILNENRVYSIQSVAGTGSIRLAVDFMKSVFPNTTVYIPDITWPNHPYVLNAAGYKVEKYRYIDSTGTGFDFAGMLQDLKACPDRSIVLLHSCAHNPTGVDPTEDEWRELLEIFKAKSLFPFFDNAYQGFVSGDPNIDAFAVRTFVEAGLNLIVACSFSKNFGLYGERLGCVHVVTGNADEKTAVGSQVRALARALYSTCPSYGARLVSLILNDETRNKAWHKQCYEMANRINQVRSLLFHALTERNVKGTWDHIVKQKGMFSFTGIKGDAVLRLKTEYHIYMLMDGRISLAGLNTSNIPVYADALLAILGTN
jgi:aspartate/tyrosine/aromatic aminotransferase